MKESALKIVHKLNLLGNAANNPVLLCDPSGHFWNWVAGAIGGAVYGLGSTLVSDIISGKISSWDTYLSNTLGGAVLLGTGNTWLAAGAQALVTDGLQTTIDCIQGEKQFDIFDFGTTALVDTGINAAGIYLGSKLFPRGVGRTPKYLFSWLTGQIGKQVIWNAGAIGGVISSVVPSAKNEINKQNENKDKIDFNGVFVDKSLLEKLQNEKSFITKPFEIKPVPAPAPVLTPQEPLTSPAPVKTPGPKIYPMPFPN